MRNVSLLTVFLMVPVLVSLGGCNKDTSNPIRDYTMKTVPANGQRPVQPIQEEPTSPFKIDVMGDNDLNFANFVEGQESIIKFNVRVLENDITAWDLVPIKIPPNSQFKSTDDPHIWILRWSPPIGTVTTATPNPKFQVELQAKAVKTSNLLLLASVGENEPLYISVIKTPLKPTILGVNGFKPEIGEGDTLSFSVDVQDPTTDQLGPQVDRFPYSQGPNLENFKADGSTYVQITPSSETKLKSNTWRYDFVLSTRGRDLPFPLDKAGNLNMQSDGITMCFNLMATSRISSNTAPEKLLCTFVRYASQTPEVRFDDPNQVTEILAGSMNSIKFTAKAPNIRGEVSIQNATPGFTTWPGNPKLNCSDGSSNPTIRSCEILWDVPCTQINHSYIFKVQATNHLSQKVKTSPLVQRELRVNTAKCPAVEPVAKPVSKSSEPVKPAAKSTESVTKPGNKPMEPVIKPVNKPVNKPTPPVDVPMEPQGDAK